jgi:DNA-directed RNA polymerase specialized sigma24 family protein
MIDLQTSSTTRSASLILSHADAELLRRIVLQSPDSLGIFYDAYAPRLALFLARAFPGDPAAADAAMEEVFWRVWKGCATRPEETAALDLWLRRIVGASCRTRGKSRPPAKPGRASRFIQAS